MGSVSFNSQVGPNDLNVCDDHWDFLSVADVTPVPSAALRSWMAETQIEAQLYGLLSSDGEYIVRIMIRFTDEADASLYRLTFGVDIV